MASGQTVHGCEGNRFERSSGAVHGKVGGQEAMSLIIASWVESVEGLARLADGGDQEDRDHPRVSPDEREAIEGAPQTVGRSGLERIFVERASLD